MGYTYSYKGEGTHAKALGNSLGISTKHAREISKNIRGMPLEKAKIYLAGVQELKQAVAFKRHKRDVGHKTGMAAGRYPVKASHAILKLLETAEANAQNKGMSVQDLVITHIVSNKDSATYKYGRQRGVKAKKTHVEVILEERKIEKKVRKSKGAKKTAPKKEVPEVKKEIQESQSDSGHQNSKGILDAPKVEEKKPEAAPEEKPKEAPKEEKKPEAPTESQEKPKTDVKQEEPAKAEKQEKVDTQ